MPKCAVKNCKNNNNKHRKKDGVTFHIFPSDPIIRERWRRIIAKERKDEHYKPSVCSVVCSRHFDNTDTYLSKKGFRRIKKFAIPHIQTKQSKSKDDLKDTDLTMSEESCSNTTQVDQTFQLDQVLNGTSESLGVQSKDIMDTQNENNSTIESFKEENFFSVQLFQPENSSSPSIKRERNGSHKKKRSDSEVSDPPIFADYEAELKKYKRKLSFKDKQIRNLRQQNRRLKEANDTMKQLLRDVRKMFS